MVRGKVAVSLIVGMALLMAAAVGTRMGVVQAGDEAYQPVRALSEKADASRLFSKPLAFLAQSTKRSEFLDPATILFDEAVAYQYATDVIAPEGLLVVVLPFAALLVGASLCPRCGGAVMTVLSAPVRRSSLYLAHVIALSAVVAALCLAAWLGGAFVLILAVPQPWDLLRLLALMLAYASLYALVFAGVGLSLGILLRSGAAALTGGLVLIVVFVGVMPALLELTARSYVARHSDAYTDYGRGGEEPSDVFWLALRAVQHTPANAVRMILWVTETFSPVRREGCMLCGTKPLRQYTIAGEACALALAAVVSLGAGGVAFARQEPEET